VTTLDTDGEQLDCSLGAALAGLARGDDSRLGRRLRVLKLRNANLSGALGKDVFARMVSLDVSMNSVTSLDGLTAAAPMLASLSASHNPLLEHFNSGPSVGAAPSGLRDLDLSHCGLTELPSLRHCASLVRATLAFNRIASLRPLPRRFPPSLVTLSLQGMAVELLPETRPLAALPNLQSLDLKGNPAVSAFPATALEPLMAFLLPRACACPPFRPCPLSPTLTPTPPPPPPPPPPRPPPPRPPPPPPAARPAPRPPVWICLPHLATLSPGRSAC